MKNFLKKICAFVLCLPALFFCACTESPSNLPAININTYYNSTVKTTLLDGNSSLSLSSLTAKEVDRNALGGFVQIEMLGNRNWLYKMYIDYITFYVYTTEARATEMIVNVTLSNMADENDRTNVSTFSAEPARFTPIENGATLCTIKIGKVVATATDSNSDFLRFDILNSVNGTIQDEMTESKTSFLWTIYGLTIYGESRAYSK